MLMATDLRLGSQAGRNTSSADQEEIEAISTCRATEVAEWIKILDRGQRTGALDVAQRQIISILATLAAGGWQKDPRTKLTSTELPQTPRRCHKDGSGDKWLDLHSVAKVGQTFD